MNRTIKQELVHTIKQKLVINSAYGATIVYSTQYRTTLDPVRDLLSLPVWLVTYGGVKMAMTSCVFDR